MRYLQGVNKIPLILYLLSTFSVAQENTESVNDHLIMTNSISINSKHSESALLSPLHKIGEGKMKVLFWKVYKAEFYAKDKYDLINVYPKALKLTYQRNIEKKEFIDATEDQWNKLNQQLAVKTVSKSVETKWLSKLSNIFPNITEDDVILFILNENKQANFYLKALQKNKTDNYKLIGSITDPLFGEHFLSIWLSKYTSEPKLRKSLLGQ